jgi:hypothetical protein
VIESGTHDELLARRGSYARLVERQVTSAIRDASVASLLQ